MNQIRIAPLATALLVLAIVLVGGAFGQGTFVPGDLIVFVHSEDQQNRVADFAAANGAKTRQLLNKKVFKISLPATKNVDETMDQLKNLPWVRLVDKNWIVRGGLSYIPNDYYMQQTPNPQWHHEAIRTPDAWFFVQSYSGKIATIDTGVYYDEVAGQKIYHEDLAANIDPAGTARNFNYDPEEDDPSVQYDVLDWDGHGTISFGLMAARGNNVIGVPGVVFNTKVIPIKVFEGRWPVTAAMLVDAIEYAVTTGAKIVNCSWNNMDAMPSVALEIYDAAAQDVLFVFSAGNGWNPVTRQFAVGVDIDITPYGGDTSTVFPCKEQLQNVICVAALDESQDLGWFSNWGKESVDLAAPGVGMFSTQIPTRFNGYAKYGSERPDGTSWSAPLVTGTLALMKQLNPSYNYRQLKDSLLLAVEPVTGLYDKTASGGTLDVRHAIRAFGDRFDDSWDGNYFFSAIPGNWPASTSARWSVIGGSCCNLTVTRLPSSSDYVAEARLSGSTYWTAAGYETTYSPGKEYNQVLTLNIADPDGMGFSQTPGRVGVGLVVQSGLTTQNCPTTGLSFQQMTIGNSVFGGIDFATGRLFVFFDPPYSEPIPPGGELPFVDLGGVSMVSIQLMTLSDRVKVRVTNSVTGDEILPWFEFLKPGNWSWVSGTWKAGFLYYSPTGSGDASIYVRSFVSTR